MLVCLKTVHSPRGAQYANIPRFSFSFSYCVTPRETHTSLVPRYTRYLGSDKILLLDLPKIRICCKELLKSFMYKDNIYKPTSVSCHSKNYREITELFKERR